MTSQEQGDIRSELAETRQELKQEIAAVRTDLSGEITGLRTEMNGLRGEMGDLRTELRGEMDELRTELRGEVRHLGVIVEALQGNVQQIAEGFLSMQDQMKSNQADAARRHAELKSLVHTSYSDLDRRLSRLEHRFST